jgi:hypothetical protein
VDRMFLHLRTSYIPPIPVHIRRHHNREETARLGNQDKDSIFSYISLGIAI